ncbi:MAG: hypothetical protein KBC22_03305 [Candidatus Pacebacteria bacterium]|nr:hypothetical protein [Candidatus Paceibacterota bacterium]
MNILEISDQYKKTADGFLNESKLISVLENYGRVEFEGSYAGNVMFSGDVDIRVVRETDFSMDEIFNIMKDIYTTCEAEFRSFYLKTDWDDPRIGEQFPNGHYLGFKTFLNNEKWKLDVWFVSEQENSRDRGVLDISDFDLTAEQRNTILEFKKYRKETGRKISGQEIYEAVLEKGITKPEQLVIQ